MSVLRVLSGLCLAFSVISTAYGQDDATGAVDPQDAPSVASARPPTPYLRNDVAGLGVLPCQAVLQRYSANYRYYESLGMGAETAYWTSFQGMLHWALGYMSHRNLVLDETGAPIVNLQPVGFDQARQLDFLRDWCQVNPTLTFHDAVEALFAELAFARAN